MAEDNSDQNIAQPQDGTQQTAPQTPSENVADEAQTSVTEPIAVPNAGEQPTTALPTVDAADGTAGNTADDTPDYASAAGERTVINNATQDAPTEQYRPAPEYGAYGPVPTPPAGDASGQTVQQPQYGAQQQGQRSSSGPSRRTTVRRSSALSATRIRPAISGTMAIRPAIRLAARPRRTARSRTISSSRSTARTCPLRDRATAIRSALRGRASRTSRTRRRSSPSRSPA